MNDQTTKPSERMRAIWTWGAVGLLLLGAAFRLWQLDSNPPGMLTAEFENMQIAETLPRGNLAVAYNVVNPARELLLYVMLSASTLFTGRHGILLWRIPFAWTGLLALAVLGQVIRRLHGTRVALLAMGLMAVAFWPVWLSRSILHASLMPLIGGLLAYVLLRAFEARQLSSSSLWFTVAGALLGLAQYTHVSAWSLPLLFVLFVAYRRIVNPRELDLHRGNIVYMLVLAAILSLPMLIYTVLNPGARLTTPFASQPGWIIDLPRRLIETFAALGLRGDMLPDHNVPGLPIYHPILGGLFMLGVGAMLARWREPASGLTLLWLLAGLLPGLLQPRSPDYELLVVAMPIIFVLPALGLRALLGAARKRWPNQARWFNVITGGIAGGLIGLSLASGYQNTFVIWPSLGDVRLNYQSDLGLLAHYLDTTTDPSPISICNLPLPPASPAFSRSVEERLEYLMHRHNPPLRYFDCTQSLVLANAGESQRIIFPEAAYYDVLPGPLLAWMRYAHDEPVEGLRPNVVMRFDGAEALANRAGSFITTAPTAWPPEIGEFRFATLPVSFGSGIDFLGYEVRRTDLRPGEFIDLTTYWRLNAAPPPELRQFAHLLGSPIAILSQNDSLGVAITTLGPRDIFLHYSPVQVPVQTRNGAYPLSIGLYYPTRDERLPVFEGEAVRANRLYLVSITVSR